MRLACDWMTRKTGAGIQESDGDELFHQSILWICKYFDILANTFQNCASMQPVMNSKDEDFGGECTDSNLSNNNRKNEDNQSHDGLGNKKMSNASTPSK